MSTLIRQLALNLALSSVEIEAVLRTAPNRYKIYQIPKRRGGFRIIAQPARELKDIQRILIDAHLSALPVHQSATAYVPAKSILTNAEMHREARVLLKLDFKDFFLNITPRDLRYVAGEAIPKLVQSEDWKWIEQAIFWRNPQNRRLCLAIGAPSSPFVSNAVMHGFDKKASTLAKRSRVIYSRYADDITLSGENTEALAKVQASLVPLLSQRGCPRLKLNPEKSGIYTKGMRRMVTGLVITPRGEISIGRARKRLISAMVHRYLTEQDRSIGHVNQLKGWLAFCNSVEPGFLNSLRRKYGVIIDEILRAPAMPREVG